MTPDENRRCLIGLSAIILVILAVFVWAVTDASPPHNTTVSAPNTTVSAPKYQWVDTVRNVACYAQYDRSQHLSCVSLR